MQITAAAVAKPRATDMRPTTGSPTGNGAAVHLQSGGAWQAQQANLSLPIGLASLTKCINQKAVQYKGPVSFVYGCS